VPESGAPSCRRASVLQRYLYVLITIPISPAPRPPPSMLRCRQRPARAKSLRRCDVAAADGHRPAWESSGRTSPSGGTCARAGEATQFRPKRAPKGSECPRSGPTNWPQSKARRPDQAASRLAALQGDRGVFELHWTAGGRPLAVRGAVGVCLGRNDVARASRCADRRRRGGRDLGSRVPEPDKLVVLTVRALDDLSECWRRKSKQNGGQSNLHLSHGFHSLCLK
jgi:hypothetical protein